MLHLSGPAPWLLAWLAGTAVQLFQPVLWSASAYALTVLGGWLICMLCRWVARRISSARSHALVLLRFCAALCAGGALAFALTGARALWFSQDALDPALEGVDLQVTGVVSSMPQWHSDGVQPRWALLQHGYRNRYGHPAPVVVQRYAARGIRMLDSPHCGAMHWRSDVPGQVLCQRELDKRYWRFGGR